MIHKEGPQFLNPARLSVPHARFLNRGALLAGPAAILCTKVLHAAAAEPRSLALSLADAAQVRPRNVSVTPALFNGRSCVGVRLSGDYPGPDRDYFAYVPGLDVRDGTIEVELAGALCQVRRPAHAVSQGWRFGSTGRAAALRARAYISAPPTAAPTTRFGVIMRRNTSLIPAMISTGYVVTRPPATSPMWMWCRRNGPGSASRCPAAVPNFWWARPRNWF